MQILPMDAYREQVVAVLDRSPLFHGLQPEHLEEAADHAELLRFEDGEALALQGEPSDSFLLLIEGGALVLLEADDDAPPLTLAHISPPDSIGEMGVLLEAPRSASVFAEGGAIVLRFETQQFHSMLLRLPYFGLVLCRTLATRLHQANRRIPLPEMGEPVDHPDDEALSLLPAAFQIRYRVLPLELHGNALRLGTVDELDEAVINLIRQQLPGMQVRVVRVTLDFFEAIMRSQSGVTGFPAPAQYAPGLAGAVVDAPRLDPLVRRMVGEGASDLHLSARQVPRWRVDGELQPLADLGALGPAEVLELLDPVMTPRARLDFETEHDAEFAYEVPEVARFRVKMFRDVHGVCAVLRRIPFRIP
ncbi:MAG: cyclic nucleotide-binding domain-containing protein, partial [Myxococcales bacterium]|nr:cyclic nucleotide-binding domain-containing protein [Myxococcales bacterium]